MSNNLTASKNHVRRFCSLGCQKKIHRDNTGAVMGIRFVGKAYSGDISRERALPDLLSGVSRDFPSGYREQGVPVPRTSVEMDI